MLRLEALRAGSQTGLTRSAAGIAAVTAAFKVVCLSLNTHCKEKKEESVGVACCCFTTRSPRN